MLNGHTVNQSVPEKIELLDKLAMEYEISVQAFGAEDYLREFYGFYEIKNRDHRLIPSPDTFYETLKEVSGDDVWEPIAKKTESLFGAPARVTVFEDITGLRDELEGPDGLAPFFSVFDLMFCEYEDFTLCYISGSNN